MEDDEELLSCDVDDEMRLGLREFLVPVPPPLAVSVR